MPELDLPVHRLTVDDVFKMVESGILDEDDRVELLDGVLVDMTPTGPDHSDVVALLNRHFVVALAPPLQVRVQDTLLVEGGFVEPDVFIVDAPARGELPSTAHLVIEVASSSLRHDTAKAMRYARAGVREYWIIDLAGRALVVHRDPHGTAYRHVERLGEDATVTALVGAPALPVASLLP